MPDSDQAPGVNSPQEELVVRLVSIDYYMTRPVPGLDECYSQLEGTTIEQVPVIRIFGCTPSGQKTCVHVHGAFPYLYVPIESSLPETTSEVDAYLRRLASSIEASSVGTTEQGAPIKRQRVFSVQLVRARKFYGYHAKEQVFVKFLLYNPMDVARVATMLQAGQVLGQTFQPHESHIPFLLQFKIDFNLFGMGFLRLDEALFRSPIPDANFPRRAGWKEAESIVHHETSPSGGIDPEFTQERRFLFRKLDKSKSRRGSSSEQSIFSLPIQAVEDRHHPISVAVTKSAFPHQLVRTRLENSSPDAKMVESLIPMWDEEKMRCSGVLPERPGSPPRTPGPLCQTVEDIRAQFQRIADSQLAQDQAAQQQVSTPGPVPSQQPVAFTPAAQSIGQALLSATPAANLTCSTAKATSPGSARRSLAYSSDSRSKAASVSQKGRANLWDEVLPEFPEQEYAQEMEQLMEWMQGAEEETNNGLDPLLALADQAETQATPAAMPSQQVALQRAESQYLTQGKKEADDIIEAASQAAEYPSPYTHRQMRMATQMAAESQGQALGNGIGAVGGFHTDVPQGPDDWNDLRSDLNQALLQAQQDSEQQQLQDPHDYQPEGPQGLHSPSHDLPRGADIPQIDGAADFYPRRRLGWDLSPHIVDPAALPAQTATNRVFVAVSVAGHGDQLPHSGKDPGKAATLDKSLDGPQCLDDKQEESFQAKGVDLESRQFQKKLSGEIAYTPSPSLTFTAVSKQQDAAKRKRGKLEEASKSQPGLQPWRNVDSRAHVIPQVDGSGDPRPRRNGSSRNRGRGRLVRRQSPHRGGTPEATPPIASEGSQRYAALSVEQSQSPYRSGKATSQHLSGTEPDREIGREVVEGQATSNITAATHTTKGQAQLKAPFRPPRRAITDYVNNLHAEGSAERRSLPRRSSSPGKKESQGEQNKSKGSAYARLQLLAIENPELAKHRLKGRGRNPSRITEPSAPAQKGKEAWPDTNRSRSAEREEAGSEQSSDGLRGEDSLGAKEDAQIVSPERDAILSREADVLDSGSAKRGGLLSRLSTRAKQPVAAAEEAATFKAVEGGLPLRGAQGRQWNRSVADVRRTHALATAARNLLHSGTSSSEQPPLKTTPSPQAIEKEGERKGLPAAVLRNPLTPNLDMSSPTSIRRTQPPVLANSLSKKLASDQDPIPDHSQDKQEASAIALSTQNRPSQRETGGEDHKVVSQGKQSLAVGLGVRAPSPSVRLIPDSQSPPDSCKASQHLQSAAAEHTIQSPKSVASSNAQYRGTQRSRQSQPRLIPDSSDEIRRSNFSPKAAELPSTPESSQPGPSAEGKPRVLPQEIRDTSEEILRSNEAPQEATLQSQNPTRHRSRATPERSLPEVLLQGQVTGEVAAPRMERPPTVLEKDESVETDHGGGQLENESQERQAVSEPSSEVSVPLLSQWPLMNEEGIQHGSAGLQRVAMEEHSPSPESSPAQIQGPAKSPSADLPAPAFLPGGLESPYDPLPMGGDYLRSGESEGMGLTPAESQPAPGSQSGTNSPELENAQMAVPDSPPHTENNSGAEKPASPQQEQDSAGREIPGRVEEPFLRVDDAIHMQQLPAVMSLQQPEIVAAGLGQVNRLNDSSASLPPAALPLSAPSQLLDLAKTPFAIRTILNDSGTIQPEPSPAVLRLKRQAGVLEITAPQGIGSVRAHFRTPGVFAALQQVDHVEDSPDRENGSSPSTWPSLPAVDNPENPAEKPPEEMMNTSHGPEEQIGMQHKQTSSVRKASESMPPPRRIPRPIQIRPSQERGSQQSQERKSQSQSQPDSDGLFMLVSMHKAPSQAELESSMAEHGVPPIVAARPYYGDPSDAPARPPIFSGVQYKLPTASVSELRPFRSLAAPSAWEKLKSNVLPLSEQDAGQGLEYVVTASRPPPPESVRRWLKSLQQAHEARKKAGSDPAANFGMDPNTGSLLLRDSGSQNSTSSAKESDLLGTPSFASPSFGPASTRLKGRSRLGLASQEFPNQPEIEGKQPPKPDSPKYDERAHFFTPAPVTEAMPVEEKEVKPSSPKYDERTFFYTTPQVRVPPPNGSKWRSPAQKRTADSACPPTKTPSTTDKQPIPQSMFDGTPFAKKPRWVSQITGPTPKAVKSQTPVSQAGFKWRVAGKGQQLTLLSLEVHAASRGSLLPDPRYDMVHCIFMAVMDDDEVAEDLKFTTRLLIFDEQIESTQDGLADVQVERFATELELLTAFSEAVLALDPDIVLGWEVQQGSLGYLVDRAAILEMPLLRAMSRTPEVASIKERQMDEYGQLHASGIHCAGRIVLNMWRLLRSEIKLNIYTFESCVAALLQQRTPRLPPWLLTQCFKEGPAGRRWRTLAYWIKRVRLNLAMLEQLDLIGRTGELARAFGIDFFSVLTRGSQYRVESLLVRMAHSQNYLMLSPNREQVGRQPAMEAIPLVMEPESTMYSDPVIVLDYQSLYPSQIIAYNLCFCTCLGRPMHAADPSQALRLGASTLCLPHGTLKGDLHPDKLTVSPNGVAWSPHSARQGVVPRLLSEILQTRIMVKAAMKRHPASAKVLQRVLNARQFGLKLIANVTYGYAAAGFSGRMPMAELADAIVQSGRQTLENTIQMVEGNPLWNARVVYGDTDSLFVLLPGRSRQEAFRIGAEIAKQATAANPPPVTLKMEKVYHPSVLASKKRYVGFMYESPDQQEPSFDAKGIETVRRDACPVVAKMLERSIRVLFSTHNISLVKDYVEQQWSKILSGRVSLADFVFAKEVRLGTYSGKGPAPPAAIVAAKAMAQDPRAEPRFSERVPYVVVHGAPGARLVDMVVTPHALVEAGGKLRLHAVYYITKQIIPALERVLNLVGADPRSWFVGMTKPQRLLPQKRPPTALPLVDLGRPGAGIGTIDQYYLSRHCAVCDLLTHAAQPLCEACRGNPQLAAAVLSSRASRLDRHNATLVRLCLHCGGGGAKLTPPPGDSIVCDSLDCAVFFERRKTAHELTASLALSNAGLSLLDV